MEYFDIRGGDVIEGTLTPSGNKNEALPVLAASLLASETVTLHNIPDILDVRIMMEIMEKMGVSITQTAPSSWQIDPSGIQNKTLDATLCKRIRTSILFAGPLLSLFGEVTLPPPGGDIIGRRRIDTHFIGFEQLGALYSVDYDGYRIVANKLKGAEIFLDEASVTATENIIMAATIADGKSVIHNAASEPHVQGLCSFLVALGADISGIGTNRLTIKGVSRLHGGTHTIGPDYIESGSFIALAAITGGTLTVKDTAPHHMRKILQTFERIGIRTEIVGQDIRVPHHPKVTIKRDMNNAVAKIDDGPWPAFPSDLMSIAVVAATQAEGTILFFEKMFESRLFFVDPLIGMGAQIILCDPHRVVVTGPSQLYGTTLESPDIRAGMALLIAAIAAKGRSKMQNIRQIDRGYEHIEQKLQALGISIERRKINS